MKTGSEGERHKYCRWGNRDDFGRKVELAKEYVRRGSV